MPCSLPAELGRLCTRTAGAGGRGVWRLRAPLAPSVCGACWHVTFRAVGSSGDPAPAGGAYKSRGRARLHHAAVEPRAAQEVPVVWSVRKVVFAPTLRHVLWRPFLGIHVYVPTTISRPQWQLRLFFSFTTEVFFFFFARNIIVRLRRAAHEFLFEAFARSSICMRAPCLRV